jgi:hypothetical protein
LHVPRGRQIGRSGGGHHLADEDGDDDIDDEADDDDDDVGDIDEEEEGEGEGDSDDIEDMHDDYMRNVDDRLDLSRSEDGPVVD